MTEQEKNGLYARLVRRANREGTFTASNGLHLTAVGDGWAEGEAAISDRLMNPLGIVNGGVYFTIMDQTAGAAACSHGSMCRTVNSEIRFFDPALGDTLYAHAKAIRLGRSIAVIRAWVTDESDTLCAEGTYTFRLKEGFPEDE